VSRQKLLTIAVLTGAAVFALFGGEYGTFDWLELKRQEREQRATIERLTVEVDSLTRYAKQVQTDRRLLEQLARDNFGMIRKGEYVYRIVIDSLDGE
jgi:cell division protein FtsB